MSSLSIPYNFKRVSELDYEFLTENKIRYRASFTDASGYFPKNPEFSHQVRGFGFQIPDVHATQIPPDPRVGATISYLALQYFEQNPEGILFFIHDSSDGKEHGRKKKFDIWYRKLSTGQLLKKDAEIPIGRFAILASILVRHDHPLLEQIIAGFDSLVMDATAKPEWAEFGDLGLVTVAGIRFGLHIGWIG